MSEPLTSDPKCISRGGCMRPEECRRHEMCMRPAIPVPDETLTHDKPELVTSKDLVKALKEGWSMGLPLEAANEIERLRGLIHKAVAAVTEDEACSPQGGRAFNIRRDAFEALIDARNQWEGFVELPTPPETCATPLCDGEVRVIYKNGEPDGVRDASGYLCHFNRVPKYAGQDERYRQELALRARQADVIATALRGAQETGDGLTYMVTIEPHTDRIKMDGRLWMIETVRAALEAYRRPPSETGVAPVDISAEITELRDIGRLLPAQAIIDLADRLAAKIRPELETPAVDPTRWAMPPEPKTWMPAWLREFHCQCETTGDAAGQCVACQAADLIEQAPSAKAGDNFSIAERMNDPAVAKKLFDVVRTGNALTKLTPEQLVETAQKEIQGLTHHEELILLEMCWRIDPKWHERDSSPNGGPAHGN